MDIDLSQARQTFITESYELLEEMETSLLGLEERPDDQDTINALFRTAHTVKGSSGILGIETVEKFTHVVENLLSRIREGEIRINSGIIELLLECRDHILTLVELASSDEDTLPDTVMEKDGVLLDRLNYYLGSKIKEQKAETVIAAKDQLTDNVNVARTDNWHISIRFGRNALKDGMDPTSFINYLPRLGAIVSLTTLCNAMPSAEEMDPENCYIGLEIDFRSDFDKKTIEDVFEFVREDSFIHILPPYSRIDSYIDLIQNLPEDTVLLGDILVKGGALTQTELEEALRMQSGQLKQETVVDETRQPLGEIVINERMVYQPVVKAALEKQQKNLETKAREAMSIRIDSSKLDTLINLVGELVIASANIDQHVQRVKDPELMESASIISRLVEDVRSNAMKIRMVPIGETFNRFQRVVRDISRDFGKEIELVISGGDTELDKTVVEKLNDPLMHLVRNAADHGIEKPEVRAAAGKPSKGTLRLNAYHDAGSIVIEVTDDGKGLSRDKIMQKALAVGLASPGQTYSDNELFRFIFEPGFSTADQITKLSGRGVGMDVVKRNIEALRGMVDIESREGAGTKVMVRLPLTLAIIDGFMVGVSESSFVIPLDMVLECVELSAADRLVTDKRNYINLRGEVLPYLRLREFFDDTGPPGEYEHVVVVQYGGSKIGLVVDILHGEVQAVIKSLGRMYRNVEGVSGATIMGDGTVALILDVPKLMGALEKSAV